MSTHVRSQAIQLRRAVWAALAGMAGGPSCAPARAAFGILPITALGLLSVATLQPAMAADSDDDLEEVMVLGSRRTTTVTDTVAPVDIISGEDFKRLGTPEMDNMLRSLVPS